MSNILTIKKLKLMFLYIFGKGLKVLKIIHTYTTKLVLNRHHLRNTGVEGSTVFAI